MVHHVVVVVVVMHVYLVRVTVCRRARRDLSRQSVQRLQHFHWSPSGDRFSVPPSLGLAYPRGRQDYFVVSGLKASTLKLYLLRVRTISPVEFLNKTETHYFFFFLLGDLSVTLSPVEDLFTYHCRRYQGAQFMRRHVLRANTSTGYLFLADRSPQQIISNKPINVPADVEYQLS